MKKPELKISYKIFRFFRELEIQYRVIRFFGIESSFNSIIKKINFWLNTTRFWDLSFIISALEMNICLFIICLAIFVRNYIILAIFLTLFLLVYRNINSSWKERERIHDRKLWKMIAKTFFEKGVIE